MSKLIMNCRVASGNRVRNEASNRVERNVIDAELPYEIIDAANVLLVRLCGKECFEEPTTLHDLSYVADLLERSDAFAHDDGLALAI